MKHFLNNFKIVFPSFSKKTKNVIYFSSTHFTQSVLLGLTDFSAIVKKANAFYDSFLPAGKGPTLNWKTMLQMGAFFFIFQGRHLFDRAVKTITVDSRYLEIQGTL